MPERLYIVEGMPCSGKSTVSAFAAELLKEKGHTVSCVDEGSGNHPADYEFNACLSEDELSEYSETEQIKIKSASEKTDNGYIVPLSEFDGELFKRLLKNKIYDFLPWEKEKPVMIDKWRSFVKNADKDTVYVFNCVFLQNPMCETMMRFSFTEKESMEYISEILKTVREMNPVVIYLKNDDIAASVKKASKEREGWLEGVIDYHINGKYGKSIKAEGFSGYISCLEERQRRELRILSQLQLNSFVLDNPQNDWAGTYEKIREFLASR